MVNEIILCVLFILAGVSVLVSLCAGAAKIGGIFTGVSGTLTRYELLALLLHCLCSSNSPRASTETLAEMQIFGIITGVTFGAAARLSYDWFATGSPALAM